MKENFSVIYLKQLKARRNSAAVEMNLSGGGGLLITLSYSLRDIFGS